MSVEINATNFPDATLRQYVSDNFDTNHDGTLNDSEIENATAVSITGLTNQKGLELLTNLETLSITNSSLTDFITRIQGDASTVWFPNLESITLQNLPNIEQISLSFVLGSNLNPHLASANISNCPKVEAISFGNTSLTELNITDCPLVRHLFINTDSVITSLDLSSFSFCSNLEMIQVSKCQQLQTIVFGDCQKLESIDISWNNLQTVFIPDAKKLKLLNCTYNTNLSNLVIFNAPSLYNLWCYNTSITFLNLENAPSVWELFNAVDPVKVTVASSGFQYYRYTRSSTNLNSPSLEIDLTTVVSGKGISIQSQPSDITAQPNETVSFAIEAAGNNINYQWEKKSYSSPYWEEIQNANGPLYSFVAAGSDNQTKYRCSVFNDLESVTSNSAQLTILETPVITQQPSSVTVYSGQEATFSIKAEGVDLVYQWQSAPSDTTPDIYWSDLSNSNIDSYTLLASSSIDGIWYRCKVTNSIGSVYSDAAQLTVEIDQRVSPPVITRHPTSITVNEGENATFSVEATGQNLVYQWAIVHDTGAIIQEVVIDGATEATYTVMASKQLNGTLYCCIVSNAAGSRSSNNAYLTVTPAASISVPRITTQPNSVIVSAGSMAGFRVYAEGGSLVYQWQVKRNGIWYDITGETSYVYNFVARTEDDGSQHRCAITNAAGSVYSTVVTLTIGSSGNLPVYGYHSIIISGKNTYGEWEMYPTSRPHVALPEVKTNYVDLPGANGGIDYTELLIGEPTYGYRKGSWEFMLIPQQRWPDVFRSLSNYLHGKIHTVVLEDDLDYEYTGRLSVNKWESLQHNSTIVIDYILEPVARNRSGETFDTDDSDFQAATRILRKSENAGKVLALWNNYATVVPISDYYEDGDNIQY